MLTKMNKCKTIWIATLIMICLSGVWLYVNCKKQDISINSDEMEVLKAQNDTLFMQNKSLDESIKSLGIQTENLKSLVDLKEIEITNLKKVKHEKITAINNYSNDKLFLFFAGINTDSSSNHW